MSSSEVVVVGAGMAGLTCAVELTRHGVDVAVLEASDAVGGRIRTDRVDTMLLDRGFQLLNPAYPALDGIVELDPLDLSPFGAGVVVASGGERTVLADPRRSPADIAGAFSSTSGSLLEKARFAAYVARTAVGSGRHLKSRSDQRYGAVLDAAGIDGRLRRKVLDPFLAGVLGEDEQESSRVFVDLQLRMFARGTPSVPAAGMQAIPEQVAARLPAGVVHLGVTARSVGDTTVHTDSVTWRGAAVVVATGGPQASVLAGLPSPRMRALTTFYHRAEHSPASRRLLHVDGDRDGPVVNTAVMSDAAPTYCSDGALVSSTILGAAQDADTRAAVTRQLGRIYGVDPSGWELVATYAIPDALPAMLPPLDLRQPVALGDGLYIAGDHRDSASIQGAIVSGRRAAAAVLGAVGGSG
jgi:phytoene dehydrogenase-like protein